MEECNNRNILVMDKNYSEVEFKELLEKKCGNEVKKAIAQYRYILLQQRDMDNEDFTEDIENFRRLFLQEFDETDFKQLIHDMKHNGWSVRGLLQEVYRRGKRVGYIANNRCRL